MFIHPVNVSSKEWSYYIQWNILIFWGIGLWIALCLNNFHYSEALSHGVALKYRKNSDSEIKTVFQAAANLENMESISCSSQMNFSLSNIIEDSISIKYIGALLLLCLVVILIFVYKNTKEKIHVLKNLSLFRFYRINVSFENIRSNALRYFLDTKILRVYQINRNIRLSEKIDNYETIRDCSQKQLSCETKEDNVHCESGKEFLGAKIVQDKIVFSDYTSLLFNNYERYSYVNYNHFESTRRKFVGQTTDCNLRRIIENYSKYSRKDETKGNDSSTRNGFTRKRIISSSPEFQEFLANLEKSRYFCPYVLEVSTNYVIRIKSIYNLPESLVK